jgi:hypothetical protein
MSVQCTTYHVMLGGVSHHFTREFRGKPYNEIHHTVGFGGRNEFAKGAVGWSAQYMKNSFNNDAFYSHWPARLSQYHAGSVHKHNGFSNGCRDRVR